MAVQRVRSTSQTREERPPSDAKDRARRLIEIYNIEEGMFCFIRYISFC